MRKLPDRARAFDVCKLKWPHCQDRAVGCFGTAAVPEFHATSVPNDCIPAPLCKLELLSGALPMPINRRRYRLQSSRTSKQSVDT